MSKRRSSRSGYRKTFLDRTGPDGVLARGAWRYLLPAGLACVAILWLFLRFLRLGYLAGPLVMLAALSVLFSLISLAVIARVGERFRRILWPTGSSTPYQRDFSFEKSLVMQGRTSEALDAYEEQIRARPAEADGYIAAADLYASSGKHDRAMDLYRQARLLRHVPEAQSMYATNRLIDLYMLSDENHDKAAGELRYLLVHWPGSQAAVAARATLGRLKREKGS